MVDRSSYVFRRLRENAARELAESLEDDHWYAVRFRRWELRGDGHPITRLRVTVTVTPLDGGVVLNPRA